MKIMVNGTEYTKVEEKPSGEIVLTSTKHPIVMRTTMEELATQYGRRTAYGVQRALMERLR